MIGFTLSITAFAKIKLNGKNYAVISLSFYEIKETELRRMRIFSFPQIISVPKNL